MTGRSYQSTALLRASPDAAWALLTDGAGWPRWNRTVDRVEGTIAPGQTVRVFMNILPDAPVPLTVTAFEPPHCMVWTGGMPLGLFQGQRTYTLEPVGDGELRFTVREAFTGLLAPLIFPRVPDLRPMFDAITTGLKAELERPR